MRTTLKMSMFAALAAFTVACSGTTQMGPGMPDPNNPDPNNPNPSGKPSPSPSTSPSPSPGMAATFSGAFDAKSPIDLTQGDVLPGVMGPILDALSTLHSCPGVSMVKMIHISNNNWFNVNWSNPASGCPTASQKSGVSGQQNSYVWANALAGAVNGIVVQQVFHNPDNSTSMVIDKIASLVQGVSEMFKKIEIRETITIGKPDASMGVDVEQQVTAIGFTVFGTQTVASLAQNTLMAAYSKTRGSITPRVAAPVADGNISFVAAPSITLPVGQLAWDNLAPIVFVPIAGQVTLGGTLSALVDCAGIAQDLYANPDVPNLVAGAFQGLCEVALTATAGAIEAAVKSITMAGSQVDNVTGVLYDVSAAKPQIDYVSDQLSDGHVTWKFVDKDIAATLTGVRK